jgi:hypothetical protein
MTDQPDQLELYRSRIDSKDNLRITGKLFVSKTGRTIGGWWITSWAENGAPYWQVRMHWFDKPENKLKNMKLFIGGFAGNRMDVGDEDTNIEPDRAKFIREAVKKWETEWMTEGCPKDA